MEIDLRFHKNHISFFEAHNLIGIQRLQSEVSFFVAGILSAPPILVFLRKPERAPKIIGEMKKLYKPIKPLAKNHI